MAELYGVVLEGVKDGGQPKVTALYERVDKDYERGSAEHVVDSTLEYIVSNLSEVLDQTAISNAPHFLMLFAATAHSLFGIPQGELQGIPEAGKPASRDEIVLRLFQIGELLETDEPPAAASAFWKASTSSTQRISSRRVRFPVYLSAIQGKSLGW